MKRVALSAGALCVVFATTVSAADMAVKARPVAAPIPVSTWTGCYIGGNAGWVGGLDNLFTHPGPPSSFQGQNFNPSPNAHSYDPRGDGGTVGGQIGCNWQTGRWVLGVEGDGNWSGLRERAFASYPAIVQTAPAATTWTAHTESLTKDMDWFATVRGRVGFTVAPQWLIYATGGAAFAHFNSSLDYNSTTGAFHLVGSTSVERVGWVVGAGTEWKFAPNWSVKAEYLYMDFGTVGFDAPIVNPTGPGDVRSWRTEVKLREQVARVGINYYFNSGPVVAKY